MGLGLRMTKATIWGFPRIGVPLNHPLSFDFPWNKTSSELGVPWGPWMEIPISQNGQTFQFGEWLYCQMDKSPCLSAWAPRLFLALPGHRHCCFLGASLPELGPRRAQKPGDAGKAQVTGRVVESWSLVAPEMGEAHEICSCRIFGMRNWY